jgi:hypothetical protein
MFALGLDQTSLYHRATSVKPHHDIAIERYNYPKGVPVRAQILTCLAAASLACAANRPTLVGTVTDLSGKPLPNATVMVYSAGVKTGYSTFCPTCYADCGKRAVTDRAGAFTISSLDPDLLFRLLVVHDGYSPAFTEKVDPSAGPAKTIPLANRTPVNDPDRIVRGKVVDAQGLPLRASVVVPIGVSMLINGQQASSYGKIEGLEPVAVTNDRGEFELGHTKKITGMLLKVEARGMASKFIAVPAGSERHTIALSDGAVIRGRLMNHGQPVAGAQIGLFPRNKAAFGGNLRIIGDPYEEMRMGTQEDGSFVIPNVPAPVDWFIYAKMDSVLALGATEPVECATKDDSQIIDVGDIVIRPGYHLRGTVKLSDGAPLAEGMRITIGAGRGFDSQTVSISPDGRFEFVSLPRGRYQIFTSVRGYRLRDTIDLAIDRDVDNFPIILDTTN